MDFNFFMPVKVISGKGCFAKNEAALKALGNRCLIMTGAGSAKKCGALDDAQAVLKSAGIDFIVYDKVEPNPLYQCALTPALQRASSAPTLF